MVEPYTPDMPANDDNLPDDAPADLQLIERPWIHLTSSYDVESWINSYDRDLRWRLGNADPAGVGICFRLELGGELFLHTTTEGEVLLDVSQEATWVSPVIGAATGIQAPASSGLWNLPGEVLVQLLLGLSSLIAAARPVIDHPFLKKRSRRW